MSRTALRQECRTMRFEEIYNRWVNRVLPQEEAADILGVSDRTFRRYLSNYKDNGLDGLLDRRLNQISWRRAPVDEVIALTTLYESRYLGWNAKHFFSFYKNKHSGKRSYTWVKKKLQIQGLIALSCKRGIHRKKRERAPIEGMMLHQDGSDHEWVPNIRWDLISTMDDATRGILTLAARTQFSAANVKIPQTYCCRSDAKVIHFNNHFR